MRLDQRHRKPVLPAMRLKTQLLILLREEDADVGNGAAEVHYVFETAKIREPTRVKETAHLLEENATLVAHIAHQVKTLDIIREGDEAVLRRKDVNSRSRQRHCTPRTFTIGNKRDASEATWKLVTPWKSTTPRTESTKRLYALTARWNTARSAPCFVRTDTSALARWNTLAC